MWNNITYNEFMFLYMSSCDNVLGLVTINPLQPKDILYKTVCVKNSNYYLLFYIHTEYEVFAIFEFAIELIRYE